MDSKDTTVTFLGHKYRLEQLLLLGQSAPQAQFALKDLELGKDADKLLHFSRHQPSYHEAPAIVYRFEGKIYVLRGLDPLRRVLQDKGPDHMVNARMVSTVSIKRARLQSPYKDR